MSIQCRNMLYRPGTHWLASQSLPCAAAGCHPIEGHGSGKEEKTLTYSDLANTAEESETFQFLADILPKKISASKYLKMLKEEKREEDEKNDSDDESDHAKLNPKPKKPRLSSSCICATNSQRESDPDSSPSLTGPLCGSGTRKAA
ncbi:Chromatin accessibility complex protein 1, partial [Plecturocebus cupreus]